MPSNPEEHADLSGLAGLPTEVSAMLQKRGRQLRLRPGERIRRSELSPDALLLLGAGIVRVHGRSASGREIVLCRIDLGDSWMLSAAGLRGFADRTALLIADTDIRAILVSRPDFDTLMALSRTFRAFVFGAYSEHIRKLVIGAGKIARQRLDARLAARLLSLRGSDGRLRLTHWQLAAELGTARQVVSRQLKEFERRGWVRLARGAITLSDIPALCRLAAMPGRARCP